MLLKGKKVILGVTGSIAAYKAAFLTRLLVKAGAEVKVVMTPAAQDFIKPLTFSVLSNNTVNSDFSDAAGNWANHVELANWADFILIAPASANSIGKLATGICDNLLLAICLSAKCSIFIAPAMDREMSGNFSIRYNLNTLKKNGIVVIPMANGELASGLHGVGRMSEPEEIIGFLQKKKTERLPFAGKKVLVTAGPTYEAVDPVRFIGNHSSGKMGFAIAEELALRGADVTLVHGPVQIEAISGNIRTVPVNSSDDMYKACIKAFPSSDITIMSAAVADYKPENIEQRKIKKSTAPVLLKLIPTADILAQLGINKKKNQLLIGFALETNNEIENARRKLKIKNLDAIILNSMRDKNSGPRGDTNKITIVDKYNKIRKFELKSKVEVAIDIVNYIEVILKNKLYK